MSSWPQTEAEITTLLIAPHRELAQQFLATLPQTRAFQILADLKSYPPHQTLDIRARQLKPNVILLDLVTDLAAAVELIKWVAALNPPVHVVGLHTHNDSTAILQSLRAGAAELKIKAGQMFQPIRVAACGRKEAPPLFETLEVLGRETCLKRIGRAIEMLAS